MIWGIRDAIHGEEVQNVVWSVEKAELRLHSILGIFMGNQPNEGGLTELGNHPSVELPEWAQFLGPIRFQCIHTPWSIMERARDTLMNGCFWATENHRVDTASVERPAGAID